MSKNAVLEEDKTKPATREQALKWLEVGLKEALHKVESGRIRKPENERVRIRWVKALGYLINSYRQLLKDQDLDSLAERISDLEGKYD